MKIFPWQNPRYYTNANGEWDFLPPEHRPNGMIPLHTDWPWPFSKIPRTWTSLEFKGAIVLCGFPEKFKWKDGHWPKPWFSQKSIIYGPFGFRKIYYCFDFMGFRFRFGPRISDDLKNSPGYVYVNYIPIPILGWFLTFGVKSLKKL